MFDKFLQEPQALANNVCLRCGLILPLYWPSHLGKLSATVREEIKLKDYITEMICPW